MNTNKGIKNYIFLILTILLSFSVVACNVENKENIKNSIQIEKNTQYPYAFLDSNGKEIIIDEEPRSVISLAPSMTEFIYELGLENRIVGRTEYCDYPSQVEEIEIVGTLKDPNIEKIVEIKPDIVIASTHFKDDIEKQLTDLGVNIVVLNDSDGFDGVYEMIGILGNIFNVKDKSNELSIKMKDKISKIEDKVKDKDRPSVYYVVGFGQHGDYTATGETFISSMIEMAGGENIAKEARGWSYSLEKIIESDPDYIIISNKSGMKEQFKKESGYKELTAVKEDRVIEIDENLLNRQGPRLALGVEELAKILHPDQFK